MSGLYIHSKCIHIAALHVIHRVDHIYMQTYHECLSMCELLVTAVRVVSSSSFGSFCFSAAAAFLALVSTVCLHNMKITHAENLVTAYSEW